MSAYKKLEVDKIGFNEKYLALYLLLLMTLNQHLERIKFYILTQPEEFKNSYNK